ncbi:MAG: hypothetical protein PHS33_08075 [Candidatus Omnitrophica bacterium]|nr:hypothetical protein [Candidatus Omnitrophota bacterium]MDD5264697.1 hypothetical protein [Candidatus Bipolaricaulis sp.]
MEDAFKDEITDEERAIQMGEKPTEPEKKEPENPDQPEKTDSLEKKDDPEKKDDKTEKEPSPEEKEKAEVKKDAESMGFKVETDKKGRTYFIDDEGTKIPEARFAKIYGKSKQADVLRRENEELKQKQTLFKELGADEYYRLYPDEKPEGYKEPEPKRPAHTETTEDYNSMVVSGGKYNGLTIGEVARGTEDFPPDPVSANLMVNNYLEGKRSAAATESQKKAKFDEDFKREKNLFLFERAKELTGKEKDWTPEELVKINGEYDRLSKWMIANKKVHYNLEDAYLLANKDEIFKRERTKAAEGAIKSIQKSGPVSIDTGNGGDNKPSGWEAIAEMDDKALEKHIDGLDDAGLTKFLQEAPASIRAKHPEIGWK